MDILSVLVFSPFLFADAPVLCPSSKEYIRTLEYLRSTQVVKISEPAARDVASEISKGCLGSADRFQDSLELLKKVGFSDVGAIKKALEFSREPVPVQKAFFEVFQVVYGSEFFDLSFQAAHDLALTYSRNYPGDLKTIAADFTAFSRFCLSEKSLARQACAELIMEMARVSDLFEHGVYGEFDQLMKSFLEDPLFQVSIKEALQLTREILRYGPQAPANFRKGFDYALSAKGLKLENRKAVEFGLKMAAHSLPRKL